MIMASSICTVSLIIKLYLPLRICNESMYRAKVIKLITGDEKNFFHS